MAEQDAISLSSGTDDRLGAAAVLVAWAAEAGPEGADAFRRLRRTGGASWSETLRQAKDIGEVQVQACSLSMDLLGIRM